MSAPCPLCDVALKGLSGTEAFALGFACGKGAERAGAHAHALMCESHRMAFTRAVLRVAQQTAEVTP